MPGAKLEQALQAALVAARKAQDKDRTLLLGTIIAAVKNHRIELGRDLTDEDVVTVLRRGVKQRQESVDQFRKAGRDTMADREESEISALKEFLPPEIGAEEIRQAVREVIAGGASQMGAVMGQVMPRFKGRADGKLVNQIVREELQAG